MRLPPTIFGIVCAFFAGMSSAHEFWIDPVNWQLSAGDEISAHLRNGEGFEGSSLGWFDKNIARAEAVFASGTATFSGRMGNRPALAIPAEDDGLVVVLHETTPAKLTYKTWDKFQRFVDHKDLGIDKAAHLARGHPETGFTESYTRHAKALISVRDGSGRDKAFGLETEIVAVTNPYDATFDNMMQIEVLYQGAPRPDAQVEIFERAPDGTVAVSLTTTDDAGGAKVPVKPGHAYLFDAVVIRDSVQDGAIYDTLWAALTFYVP